MIKDLFSVKDYIVLLTGATGYLGREIALGLAQSGAKVYINGRDQKKLIQIQEDFKKHNLTVHLAHFDINSDDEIQKYFNDFKEDHINLVVNNAYAGKSGAMNSTRENFLESYNVSVASSFVLVKNCEQFLLKAVSLGQEATVINIASMYGMVSPKFDIYDNEESFNPPFYGSAKAGVIQLTKYLSTLLAPKKIRVNSISPGPFPSEKAQENEKLIKGIVSKSPMKRVGKPEELIGAVIYLASKASSYTTGANLVVDGGWTASS